MPNWVYTAIAARSKSKLDLERFIRKYFTREADGQLEFDFNKVVPEPTKKEDCDCLVNEDSHIEPDAERPWFDWYEWHCKHWGTKWSACDSWGDVEVLADVDGTYVVKFGFNTAWSLPEPIFDELIDQLDLFEYPIRLTIDYYEESMEFGGTISYDESLERYIDDEVDMDDKKAREKFLIERWDYEPEDFEDEEEEEEEEEEESKDE